MINLIDKLKGAIRKMLSPKQIEDALHIQPTISSKMKEAIELWEDMYKDEEPWVVGDVSGNTKSLGLPALIASEKARTATIEMKVKVTGDGDRAEFIKDAMNRLVDKLRIQLEYGIALGGLVIKPYVVPGVDKDGKETYKIQFAFSKATEFFPLSFSADGSVTEAAFVDRIITRDGTYSKLEYHKLEGTTLTVINKAYHSSNRGSQVVSGMRSELGTEVPLTEIPQWANIQEVTTIENIDTLLFAYFKMPQANTVDLDSPLGVSGFSKACDLIKHADEQFSDLLWEFEGGQLAIDVDNTAFQPYYDARGKERVSLPHLQDRLYRRALDLGDDNAYNVFSPNLRDANIINGLNNILMRIEDVCDLSRGTLSEVGTSEARTATELKILKQRSFSANQDIQKELQRTLEQVVKIIDRYCDLYNIVPSGDFEVGYDWDDSILVDKDAERQVDMLDVDKGIMSKVEYRMKWYGETEEQAQEALDKVNEEAEKKIELQQQAMIATGQGINGTQADKQQQDDNKGNEPKGEEKNDPGANPKNASDKQSKLDKANKSGEKTNNKQAKNARGY